MKPEKRWCIPDYPPSIAETFTSLCHSVNRYASVPHLQSELKSYRDRILKLEKRLAPHHFRTGLALYDRAMAALRPIDLYSADQRTLVVAAVEYIVRQQDGIDDQRPIVGFEDDVKILNHVLEELEMFSLFILPHFP